MECLGQWVPLAACRANALAIRRVCSTSVLRRCPPRFFRSGCPSPSLWLKNLTARRLKLAMSQSRRRACGYLVAVAGATRLPPPRSDDSAAAPPRLLIRWHLSVCLVRSWPPYLKVVPLSTTCSRQLGPTSQDHSRILRAAVNRPPADWRLWAGRPRRTWLCTLELDLRPHNVGLNTAWMRAQDRSKWRQLVETAMLNDGRATRWWWWDAYYL